MLFMIVVFPVPGPPVTIHTLLSFTDFNASFCFSDNSILIAFSFFDNSFSKSFINLIFFYTRTKEA